MRVYHLGHCSFCLKKTRALLVDEGYVTRNLYRCSDCGRKLVVCRACNNLACWDSYTVSGKQVEQHDQFCGEHRGLVPNFDTQDVSLSSPVDWRTVYDHRSTNLAKVSAVTLAGIGGVAVAAPLAALAGPAIGGIIGAKFMGLSGVAATNAGLAFLGGGSLAAGGFGMAGGMAVVTAAGGILGGPLAAYLCNQYLGDISGFDIVQMRSGRQPAVITISGFLTEGQSPKSTWGQLLGRGSLFADHEWVHVRWEAKRLGALSKLAAHGGTAVLRKAAVEAAKKASKAAAKKLLPITAVADIAALAWEIARSNVHWGRIRIANQLALLNIFIAASTVSRILNRPRPRNPAPMVTQNDGACTEDTRRSIPAWYPNHVWSVDLTTVNRWGLWPTFVLVAIDHFSRKVICVRPLDGPNAGWVADELDAAFEKHGVPKHIITDQGSVFTGGTFRELLSRWNVKHRLGAVGQHGSIAVTERVIETLKYEWLRPVPLIKGFDHLEGLCAGFFDWYNNWRPHMSLGGQRPGDVFDGRPVNGPDRTAKVVPFNVGRRVFPEQRLTGYRLRKAA